MTMGTVTLAGYGFETIVSTATGKPENNLLKGIIYGSSSSFAYLLFYPYYVGLTLRYCDIGVGQE